MQMNLNINLNNKMIGEQRFNDSVSLLRYFNRLQKIKGDKNDAINLLIYSFHLQVQINGTVMDKIPFCQIQTMTSMLFKESYRIIKIELLGGTPEDAISFRCQTNQKTLELIEKLKLLKRQADKFPNFSDLAAQQIQGIQYIKFKQPALSIVYKRFTTKIQEDRLKEGLFFRQKQKLQQFEMQAKIQGFEKERQALLLHKQMAKMDIQVDENRNADPRMRIGYDEMFKLQGYSSQLDEQKASTIKSKDQLQQQLLYQDFIPPQPQDLSKIFFPLQLKHINQSAKKHQKMDIQPKSIMNPIQEQTCQSLKINSKDKGFYKILQGYNVSIELMNATDQKKGIQLLKAKKQHISSDHLQRITATIKLLYFLMDYPYPISDKHTQSKEVEEVQKEIYVILNDQSMGVPDYVKQTMARANQNCQQWKIINSKFKKDDSIGLMKQMEKL